MPGFDRSIVGEQIFLLRVPSFPAVFCVMHNVSMNMQQQSDRPKWAVLKFQSNIYSAQDLKTSPLPTL